MDPGPTLVHVMCALMCLMWNTTASHIEFTTTPNSIQPMLTESLTLRCSLKDSPTTGTLGIIGKRHASFEVTPLGHASLDTTSRSTRQSDIRFVHSVVITKGGNDVATVAGHVTARGFDNSTGFHVTGHVPGSAGEKGFLQVSWTYPLHDQSGSYSCVITGIDDMGHIHTLSQTVDVTDSEVTINNLVGLIHQLKLTNDAQTATITNNTEDMKDLRQLITDQKQINADHTTSISELKQKNADMKLELTAQATSIADLKKKQDTHVVFTAGLDHSTRVPKDGVLVFNHVITSLGGGYDNSTGVFTCPVAGYYIFHIHVMGQKDQNARLCVNHNNQCPVAVIADNLYDHQAASTSVTFRLQLGDQVKVTAMQDSYPFGEWDMFTVFTGHLVALL